VQWQECPCAMPCMRRPGATVRCACAGKVRHWGLSNESAYGVTMFCETAKRLGVPLPITIQNDYSLCERCVHFDCPLDKGCAHAITPHACPLPA
jgi:aryl-alcohol dehydrogenase-like predicted oxidoreductase